jgi:peptide-methionine (S)-S-oxide reductase
LTLLPSRAQNTPAINLWRDDIHSQRASNRCSEGVTEWQFEHPTYKEVCTDRTGHAEVVEVTFDPSRLPYETLLDTFFALHDPTQVNRQGPDWGTQYRSVIFTHNDQQFAQARAKIAELNASGSYRKPIATQIVPATTFWKAEEYHQKYLEKRGMVSCHI